MLIGVVANVVSVIGLDAVKSYLPEKHDTKKLKDEIRDFAEKEFEANYKHLSLSEEIDFGGLLLRVSADYIEEIKVYLFDTDISVRKRCFNSILERTYYHAGAINDAKKSEIKHFVETSIEISRNYFIGNFFW